MNWLALHQYSLRTSLGLMTGAQIAIALVTWDRDSGCLAAIPIVCGWGMLAAIKARRYRVAYALATWFIGSLFYAALSLPASGAGYDFLQVWKYWPDVNGVVAMCLATGLAGLFFQPWVRKLPARYVVVVGAGFAYFTLALYPLAWVVAGAIFHPMTGPPPTCPGTMNAVSVTFGGLCRDALAAIPTTTLVITWSLHIALPAGIAGVCLFHWILLLATDLSGTEKSVLNAVQELEGAGRDPIRCYHIAGRLGCDAQTAETWLEKLLQLHRLTWSPRHGFRRIR
jgi:hypothetical protein